LRQWAAGFADVAAVDIGETAGHWRLNLVPHEAAACPVEIVLYSNQRYDCAIGGEIYEDQPATDLAHMLPLLEAITQGRLVTRVWRSRATAAALAVATIVETNAGAWQREHADTLFARIGVRDTATLHDRHYAPYRRAVA